ncbi:hypothetical protein CAPTEDRAFT_201365 [Capitella teleta]|uniref:UPAR/Ly6 domain-containing protein n=1 Tax=Capitella teleta TaxID=283909 RepID=R7TC70_CAPTE|nr:hypothetical protein CAPTEDRAFT_201365 [Capitella teleta]|eukprot:ELT91117.1 hypothetical protein CAPTEDRAFT_201365 [Capitella teleta]
MGHHLADFHLMELIVTFIMQPIHGQGLASYSNDTPKSRDLLCFSCSGQSCPATMYTYPVSDMVIGCQACYKEWYPGSEESCGVIETDGQTSGYCICYSDYCNSADKVTWTLGDASSVDTNLLPKQLPGRGTQFTILGARKTKDHYGYAHYILVLAPFETRIPCIVTHKQLCFCHHQLPLFAKLYVFE